MRLRREFFNNLAEEKFAGCLKEAERNSRSHQRCKITKDKFQAHSGVLEGTFPFICRVGSSVTCPPDAQCVVFQICALRMRDLLITEEDDYEPRRRKRMHYLT